MDLFLISGNNIFQLFKDLTKRYKQAFNDENILTNGALLLANNFCDRVF